MSTQTHPDFSVEAALQEKGFAHIAGVDEAGRGPWAGPVVAAAAILKENRIPDGLDDSKKISPLKRDGLFEELVKTAQIGVGIVEVSEIDDLNILQASLKAMKQALDNLPITPCFALIDGNKCPSVSLPCQSVIKGDGKCLSIAAASIIAKVTRDRIMKNIAGDFPGYGWEKNNGYGTRQHAEALQELGVTPHHRRSFAPIKKMLTPGP